MRRFEYNKRNGQIITQDIIDKARLVVNLKEPPKQPIDIIFALAGPYDYRQSTFFARGKMQSQNTRYRSVFDGALCFKRYFKTDYNTFTRGLDYLYEINYIDKRFCGDIRKDTFVYKGNTYPSFYNPKVLSSQEIQTFNNIILGAND